MKIQCAHDALLPLHEIIENPKNPNKHPQSQIDRLAKLIDYQGQRHPIIISKRSGFVVVGHGRLEAIKKLGWEKAAVNYQDFENEAQEYAFVVSDNAIAEWAELDLSAINTEMLDLGPDFDVDLLGIEDFVVEPTEKLPDGDLDAVPAALPDPKVVRGEVYILGKHRLMCGDSTSVTDVEKLMAGAKAELAFTDPPYRMAAEGGIDQPIGRAAAKLGEAIKHLCEFDPVAFLQTIPTVFEKNVMNAYIFCNKDLVPEYLNWALEAGYNFNILFWKKPVAIPLGGNHRPDVEYLLLFRRSATWNNGVSGVNYSKCLEYGRVTDKEQTGGHPTPKPIELIENEIQISSSRDGIVVDFFGGSGSTMIACEKQKRASHLMELDPKYCQVILDRWQKFTGKKAHREDGVPWDEIRGA